MHRGFPLNIAQIRTDRARARAVVRQQDGYRTDPPKSKFQFFAQESTDTGQSDTKDEHGSVLDRTASGLKPILTGSGLDRITIFFKIGVSGLDQTEKIFVVLMWLFWKYQKF